MNQTIIDSTLQTLENLPGQDKIILGVGVCVYIIFGFLLWKSYKDTHSNLTTEQFNC